jgi:poly-beta-1,6-N-acetyl-D-glucosamine synthase
MKYVLVTPARNEEKFIEKTLRSMTAQTLRPERWVIVDDGSTDGTLPLVQQYAPNHPWIEVVQRQQRAERSFSGKVDAFNAGLERVRPLSFDVIGNLDGDVSFEPDYLEFLLRRFAEDPKLGVAGTPFLENGYDSAVHSFEGENHVAGGCQLFRRECFQDIGGYVSHAAGGVDWIAVTTARMRRWKTRSFPEKRFHHYRALGTAERGQIAALFSYGEKDYYLGNSPIWELFRVCYRIIKPPYFIAGLSLLSGFCWAALRRTRRPASRELIRFHRKEQMHKLGAICKAVLRRQKVDSFRLAPE